MEETKKLAIGIDLGSSDSYVAYINNGTIDLVQNEVSQRRTPSLVGFTERERLLGDSALSQIKSIVKNTCRNFKHYLGQKLDSPSMESEKFWWIPAHSAVLDLLEPDAVIRHRRSFGPRVNCGMMKTAMLGVACNTKVKPQCFRRQLLPRCF